MRTSLEMSCFLENSCGSQSDTLVACFQLTVHCLGYGLCSDWYYKGMGNSYASCDDCISQGSPERQNQWEIKYVFINKYKININKINIFLYSIKIKKYWFVHIARDVFIFFKIYWFSFLWLLWVFVAVHGLSPVAESGGFSLVVVWGLLIAVAPLVWEHEL